MIDYAHPTMMAEKHLKELHNAMLDKNYEMAVMFGLQAIAETKLSIDAIHHAIEEEKKKEKR